MEGLLCGLADGLDALRAQGVDVARVLLVGGGARARRRCAGSRRPCSATAVLVPPPGEYVADGAARQAAWVLSGAGAPPVWAQARRTRYEADAIPAVRARYARGARTHRGAPR